MKAKQRLRVVLDTNVILEGLTKQAGVAGTIINANAVIGIVSAVGWSHT